MRAHAKIGPLWLTGTLLLLAIGLQFQIVLPVGTTGLKVCPADIAAAFLAVQMILHHPRDGAVPLSRCRTLPYWLAACTMVLVISVAIGFIRSGHISTWGLGNKLIGWGVLLTYLASGLFVGSALGEGGQRWFARLLIYACVGTGLLAVLLVLVVGYTRILPQIVTHFPVRGFVNNRNAFAFLQISAMALLLAHGWARTPFLGRREREILCGICGAVIVYSGSRSGLPTFAIVILVALLMRAISPGSLIRSILYALACWLGLELARDVMIWFMQYYDASKVKSMGMFGAGLPPLFMNPPQLVVHDTTAGSSDAERLNSYLEAVELWLTAPVFGAGLGSALDASIAKHGTPLITHNTALWLLSETGIVGLAAFIGLGWVTTRSLFPLRTEDDRAHFRLAALLILILFTIMSLAHEMLYQRTLWLVLGWALAVPQAGGDRSKEAAECAD